MVRPSDVGDLHLIIALKAPAADFASALPAGSIPPAGDEDRLLVKTVLDSLENSKAEEILPIDIRGRTSLADHMVIASGHVDHPLRAVMDGARATWFLATGNPVTSRKKWIAGSLAPLGVGAGRGGEVRHRILGRIEAVGGGVVEARHHGLGARGEGAALGP